MGVAAVAILDFFDFDLNPLDLNEEHELGKADREVVSLSAVQCQACRKYDSPCAPSWFATKLALK